MSKSSTATENLLSNITYIDDHLVMTPRDVWVYVSLPPIAYNLPDQGDINDMILDVEKVLVSLGNGHDADFRFHLAQAPYNVTQWSNQLNEHTRKPAPAWAQYLEDMSEVVDLQEFRDPHLYMGVRVGTRSYVADETEKITQTRTPLQWMIKRGQAIFSHALGPDLQPSEAEVRQWRRAADKISTALGSSRLRAQRVSAFSMAQHLQHLQRLGLRGTPPMVSSVWGAGSSVTLRPEAVIDNSDPSKLSIKLTARDADPRSEFPVMESHVAILSVAVLPDTVAGPWLFHTGRFEFPVEVSANFKLLKPANAEKRAEKALNKQVAILDEVAVAGGEAHGLDIRRARRAKELQTSLAAGTALQQVVGTVRFIVTADSREELGRRADEVIRWYREDSPDEIHLEWSPGDQLKFYRDLFPAAANPSALYTQEMELRTFCVGLPFSAIRLGDGEGPYLGQTLIGQPNPVMYDVARAARIGTAPTVLIAGGLGGGKSNLASTLIDHMRLRGWKTILLDPKGDFKAHALLKGRGSCRVFDVSSDGRPGSLDPYRIVSMWVDEKDPLRSTQAKAQARWQEETNQLIRDVLDALLPGSSESEMRVLDLTLWQMIRSERPSMAKLLRGLDDAICVEALRTRVSDTTTLDNYAAVSIGLATRLKGMAATPLGRLIFGVDEDENVSPFMGEVDTLIVTMTHLDFSESTAPNDTRKLSAALFTLITQQCYGMLRTLDAKEPRGLFIDEAHMVARMASGRDLIAENARTARSRNIAMGLITQSMSEFDTETLRNAFGAAFVFRTPSIHERRTVAKLIGREGSESIINTIPTAVTDQWGNPTAGRCLFYDVDSNVTLMQVHRWHDDYAEHFESNQDGERTTAGSRRLTTDEFGFTFDETPVLASVSPSSDDLW